MVNQQLINYIKTEEAQGYTPQQLRNYLIQQGYNSAEVDEAIKYANTRGIYPPQQAQPQGKVEEMKFFEKVVLIIKDPNQFFNNIKNEPGIKKALVFYILWILLTSAIQIIIGLIMSFVKGGLIGGAFGVLGSLLSMLLLPLILILLIPLIFLLVLMYHGLVKIVKGEKPFNMTFKAIVYCTIPGSILSMVTPILTLMAPKEVIVYVSWSIGLLWGIILFVIALTKLQEISYIKAIIVAIIPTLILILVVTLIASIFVGSTAGSLPLTMGVG